jgi:hypothetical protein
LTEQAKYFRDSTEKCGESNAAISAYMPASRQAMSFAGVFIDASLLVFEPA